MGNNKKNAKLARVVRVVSLSIIYAFFPVLIGGFIWVGFIFEKDPVLGEKTEALFLATLFVIGAVSCISLCFVGGPSKKKKADTFPCFSQNYFEWEKGVSQMIVAYGYQLYQEVALEDGRLSFFVQSQRHDLISCIAIIQFLQLSKENVECANDKITELLKKYLTCNVIHNSIDMISVFCVDSASPTFYGLVNRPIKQGLKNGRFVAGICFNNGKVYVGNFSGGYGKSKYRNLRKCFFSLTGLEE